MSEVQLNIALEKIENPLQQALAEGRFVYLAECHAPEDERSLPQAAERIMPLAEKMWSFDDLCGGLAILDLPESPFSAIELLSALPENNRNRNCAFLSGSGRNADDIANELKHAAGAGIENITAVSGDAFPRTLKQCRSRQYTDSIKSLQMMHDADSFFTGSTINPFHYRADTLWGTLGNFKRKLAAGSDFIVVQSGWDMLQIQTLSWYMLRNRFYTPYLVRLTLLTPDKVERIVAGEVPGLRISRDFRKLLEQELCGNSAQFEAAQYRRLELQAAGARLMGASGVIVSGANYPGKAEIVARKLRSALAEFKSFDHWLDEYNQHQAGVEMTNSLHNYRLYDRILRRNYPFEEPPAGNDPGEFPISRKERIGQKLRKMFFSNAHCYRASRDRLMKKILASCRGCQHCRLPEHEFVCVENCPKGLEYGPCGGVREDGKCEIGNFECVHVKIVRYSSHRKPHLE
ncbi:MAG: methylenetetrahydrofolate reductase C-terminal domain-containing protein [Lentisphaeria bacterium]|nr:methylenetetrahydrofolate reductase C-terminal domain-containing protein [Lentisphaeria bacterium]